MKKKKIPSLHYDLIYLYLRLCSFRTEQLFFKGLIKKKKEQIHKDQNTIIRLAIRSCENINNIIALFHIQYQN